MFILAHFFNRHSLWDFTWEFSLLDFCLCECDVYVVKSFLQATRKQAEWEKTWLKSSFLVSRVKLVPEYFFKNSNLLVTDLANPIGSYLILSPRFWEKNGGIPHMHIHTHKHAYSLGEDS